MTSVSARPRFAFILISASLIVGSIALRSAAQAASHCLRGGCHLQRSSPSCNANGSFAQVWIGAHSNGAWSTEPARRDPSSIRTTRSAGIVDARRQAQLLRACRRRSCINPQSPTQSTSECTPSEPRPVQTPSDVAMSVQYAANLERGDSGQAPQRRRFDVVGWRRPANSRGGNMWPAVAGRARSSATGPLGFIDASNRATPWGYAEGAAFLGDRAVETVTSPYRLASRTRVAVLTDVGVASSGEAIAIAFRARPDTRSFGTPTCGLSTAVNQSRSRRADELRWSSRRGGPDHDNTDRGSSLTR